VKQAHIFLRRPFELQHYMRVIAALDGTIAVQSKIDAAIPGWPLG
jgi:hypothetical protein